MAVGDTVHFGPSSTGHCPVCKTCITAVLRVCPRCDTGYHTECWDYSGGCSVFGCDARPVAAPEALDPPKPGPTFEAGGWSPTVGELLCRVAFLVPCGMLVGNSILEVLPFALAISGLAVVLFARGRVQHRIRGTDLSPCQQTMEAALAGWWTAIVGVWMLNIMRPAQHIPTWGPRLLLVAALGAGFLCWYRYFPQNGGKGLGTRRARSVLFAAGFVPLVLGPLFGELAIARLTFGLMMAGALLRYRDSRLAGARSAAWSAVALAVVSLGLWARVDLQNPPVQSNPRWLGCLSCTHLAVAPSEPVLLEGEGWRRAIQILHHIAQIPYYKDAGRRHLGSNGYCSLCQRFSDLSCAGREITETELKRLLTDPAAIPQCAWLRDEVPAGAFRVLAVPATWSGSEEWVVSTGPGQQRVRIRLRSGLPDLLRSPSRSKCRLEPYEGHMVLPPGDGPVDLALCAPGYSFTGDRLSLMINHCPATAHPQLQAKRTEFNQRKVVDAILRFWRQSSNRTGR
jgi:hypothetical protein